MAGSIGYEVFLTEAEYDAKTAAIETLLGIPNSVNTAAREKIKHDTLEKWCGTVNQTLVDATEELSDEECLPYYNRNELVTPATLNSGGWFPS